MLVFAQEQCSIKSSRDNDDFSLVQQFSQSVRLSFYLSLVFPSKTLRQVNFGGGGVGVENTGNLFGKGSGKHKEMGRVK